MIINAIPVMGVFLNSLEATEIMKKILALVLAAVMLLGAVSLASCSSKKKDPNDESLNGAQIQMYLCDFPDNLDPTWVMYGNPAAPAGTSFYGSQEQIKLFGLLYEGLYTIDEKGELDELVADEHTFYIDPLDDTLKLEISIRDTRWSDGVPVDADDFVYAWQRLLKPENNNPAATLLYPIKNAQAVKEGLCSVNDLGVCAVKDKVIQITFEEGFVNVEYFLRRLASPALVPLREDNATKFDDAANVDYTWNTKTLVGLPLTNGAFKYKRVTDASLELERNLHYDSVSQIEDNAPDKVVKPYRLITLYSEGATADKQMERFNKKEAFYVNLSSASADAVKAAGKKVEQTEIPSTYSLFLDTTNELFANPKVRQALSMALDRSKINSLTGRETKAAEGIVPFGVEDTMEDTSFRKEAGNIYKYDVNGAKALLKEAGVSGGTIILFYDKTRAYEADVVKTIADSWKALGFAVSTLDHADYSKHADRARVIAMDFQAVTPDAYSMLMAFSTKFGGGYVDVASGDVARSANFTGFSDEKYDEICGRILSATGYADRASAMHEAEKYLAEAAPVIGVLNNTDVYIVSDKLDKLDTDMFGARNFTKIKMKDFEKYLPKEEEAPAEAAK